MWCRRDWPGRSLLAALCVFTCVAAAAARSRKPAAPPPLCPTGDVFHRQSGERLPPACAAAAAAAAASGPGRAPCSKSPHGWGYDAFHGQTGAACRLECDADSHNIIFVSGFHHTGTTLVQHQLQQHLTGQPPVRRHPERWGYTQGTDTTRYFRFQRTRKNYAPVCVVGRESAVLKRPIGTLVDFQIMSHMRDHMSNVKFVWMRRNIGDTVWSVFKRTFKFNVALPKDATGTGEEHRRVSHTMDPVWFRSKCLHITKNMCSVNQLFSRALQEFERQAPGHAWHVDLQNFTAHPAAILEMITGVKAAPREAQSHGRRLNHTLAGMSSKESTWTAAAAAAASAPDATDHNQRRIWQVMHGVQKDNEYLYRSQFGSMCHGCVQYLDSIDCNNKTTW